MWTRRNLDAPERNGPNSGEFGYVWKADRKRDREDGDDRD
jgi:hypothetical protein